jgi:predicted transport protein
VLHKIGRDVAEQVDWSAPRLVCIAGDFSRYDEHAVKQVRRNIELIRYRRFGSDLLLLDLVTAITDESSSEFNDLDAATHSATVARTVSEDLLAADAELRDLFSLLRAYLLSLGDDVQERTLKKYFAFTRIQNFTCVEIKPVARKLLAYVKADPERVTLEPGFTRDVREIGHYGTGDMEITLTSKADVERAKLLLKESYDRS